MKAYKQEIFYEEDSAKKFINKLQNEGAHYNIRYEDYYDEIGFVCKCFVIDYQD